MQGAEHYALDTPHETLEPIVEPTETLEPVAEPTETLEPTAQPTEDGTNSGNGDNAAPSENVISGHAYNAAGEALEGVNIYIRVVPESSGEPYQTTTDATGAYSYSVPEGVYLISAEYNSKDEPGGSVYLDPTNGDGSVTVPPSAEVDFQSSS